MARNRKRAKDRRARHPQGASVPAGARTDREQAPEPIEHATPDVELAEAQLAIGRPEPAADAAEAEADEEEFELEVEESERRAAGEANGAEAPAAGSRLTAPGAEVVEHRPGPGNRLINFLQGSWRELQRVQWPDRRQVMQATGVVIGFVIVAGVFLGVSDFLAGKLMNYILK